MDANVTRFLRKVWLKLFAKCLNDCLLSSVGDLADEWMNQAQQLGGS